MKNVTRNGYECSIRSIKYIRMSCNLNQRLAYKHGTTRLENCSNYSRIGLQEYPVNSQSYCHRHKCRGLHQQPSNSQPTHNKAINNKVDNKQTNKNHSKPCQEASDMKSKTQNPRSALSHYLEIWILQLRKALRSTLTTCAASRRPSTNFLNK